MLGSSPGREPRVPGLRVRPRWVLWRLGGLLCLLGLEGALGLAGPSSAPPAVSSNNQGVNVYMSLEEVKKFLASLYLFKPIILMCSLAGLDAELYYVRDNVVSHFALSFVMPVPSDTNSLHFTWYSKTKVDYRLGFNVENPAAMNQPKSNISSLGEVPRVSSVFRVDLFCSGKVNGEAVLTVQLNLTIQASNFTVLNFKRRKICYKRIDPDSKLPALPNNATLQRPELDGVSTPTTSTRVFYISVSVCCIVIFLVAIILAILHLHSMKRVEMEDSVSDSGSSQGLSQPSTQTTQYLRADTPNNAASVTNNHPGSAPILQLAATSSSYPNPGAPAHETKSYPSLRIEKNDLRSVTLMEAKAKVKDIAISRERVTLRDVLHEGTFGRIFHGVLLDEKDPTKEKQVFVKTVKGHHDVDGELQATWAPPQSIARCPERTTMRTCRDAIHDTPRVAQGKVLPIAACSFNVCFVFSSRNLLPISQVCTEDGEKPMVLLPFMAWGNLKLFLRQCKLAEANNPQAVSQQDLVYMVIQVACGMSYLARREVIHKDLAARNCVIDDNMQVKITDNALARDLFPMDYHCLGDNENRPVRWMALESLLNNDFSSASDVWAFGVTLWELMTLGQTPYVDIDPFEMSAYLKDGYRIAQPINCPDELFAVMACCWALDPEERPKFQQLVQCLTEFHAALGAYV
ncbi:Tyrosine-protein kinase RYK [Merluccius polli]|uniref:receptor protein-tyrosine kinase n=2 Tax=Acanthomorphata TaxID=123368 RepID=A0AA47MD18_MERPO|nr:Tyrosine-protein kinase RYK [Merluccius polli]